MIQEVQSMISRILIATGQDIKPTTLGNGFLLWWIVDVFPWLGLQNLQTTCQSIL